MQEKSDGFTLLEVLVVVIIMAIAAAIVVPRFKRRPLSFEKQMLYQLNNLTRMAHLNALMTGKLHRIRFDFKQNRILAELASGKKDSQGTVIFEPMRLAYTRAYASLDEALEVDRMIVQGKNLISRGEGLLTTGVWFYIVPEGLTQEVTIGMSEKESKKSFSLILNPFTAQFRVAE